MTSSPLEEITIGAHVADEEIDVDTDELRTVTSLGHAVPATRGVDDVSQLVDDRINRNLVIRVHEELELRITPSA